MALFKSEQEIYYEKPITEALIDMEKALSAIGKIQKIDKEDGVIQGKTKYGLQTVKINIKVVESNDKTKIIFYGKSDDVGGVGAQKGIDNLLATIKNLDNTEYVPSKTGGVKPIWILAVIVEFILGIIVVLDLRIGYFQPNLRTTLIVMWIGLFLYLVLSRRKTNGKIKSGK